LHEITFVGLLMFVLFALVVCFYAVVLFGVWGWSVLLFLLRVTDKIGLTSWQRLTRVAEST